MEVDSGMVVANDERASVKGDGTDENDNNGVESKSGSLRKMSLKGSENGVESVEDMDTSSTPNGEVKEVVKVNEVEEKMDVEHSSVTAEANGNCEEDKENLEKGVKSAELTEESKAREAEESSAKTEETSEIEGEGAKPEKEDAEQEKTGDDSKDQTIIITETKSLAKAINDAVKKPDGKPTLVIIESKTGSSSGNAPPTTPGGSKASKVPPVSPSTGMTLRSRNRPATTATTSTQNAKAVHKNTGATRTDSDRVALKDDSEINIYTPSLMVPYIYETSPKEKLHDFLAKIGALTKKVDQEEIEKEKAKEIEKEKEKAIEKEKVKEIEKEKVKDTEKEKVKEIENEKVKEGGDQTDKKEEVVPAEPKKEKTFFDTVLGMFFVDIGLLQAQRWVQAEVLKGEKRKLDKGWSSKERKSLVARIGKSLEDIDKQVKPYKFVMKTCKRCDFKTESQTVLERHLETIHVTANKMVCSYCDYFTLEPTQIFEHLNSAHKRFGRLERPLALHQCPMCPVEDSAKARVTRHMWKCAKTFVPDKNQAPSTDFEPPAKRMRHLATVGTLKAMRAGMVVDKMSSAAALNPTHMYQMHQQQQNRGAPRAQPAPIRPKPGDIRLSPAYVQSVLRGQYMSSNVRGMTPNLVSGSLMRQSMAQRNSSSAGGGAYMLRQPNPVVTSINSLNNPLQASQLFQVINPSTAGGLVPLVSSGRIGGLSSAQRFTILPTSSVNMNNRGGPTPVALIPNLVTNSKSASNLPTNLTFSQLQNRSGTSQGLTNASAKGVTQKPNISITPVSKMGGNTSGGGTTVNANRLNAANKSSGSSGGSAGTRLSNQNAAQSNQSQNQQGQGGGGYVVCEICDGYIKDLDQLRNHMQWIHKVKIHPKMIHNRPPLNCQKCHFRFFTDQGLERHLLGSHGLVTSSMQENANKGKDGGRCIICGKVFLWKLVVHMAKDHKMTLKPAHLSYKCTVCSATFNMYRLFETHVYDEHSTVAKRVLDGQKGGPSNQASKSKVNTTPSSNQAQQQQRRIEGVAGGSGSSSVGGRMGPAATSTPRPATSRITLHPEPRVCDDCGVTFKRGGNCDRHWEPTKLKPCNASLCRVDKCDSCLQKSASISNSKAAAVSALIAAAAAAKSTITMAPSSTTIKTQQKVATSSANGKTEKVIAPVEKVSSNKEKENKVQVPVPKQPQQQNPSDGEDVFDMEVETVDENGSSARSDVESD